MCADGCDFRLYPDCKIVHGAVRSAIYDLRRNAIHLIPKDVAAAFIGDACDRSLLPEKRWEEVLSFFMEAELGRTGMPASFKPVPEDFICASTITNAIIDLGFSPLPMRKLARELDGLLCEAVYLRFMEGFNLQDVVTDAKFFLDISVSNIDIALPFCGDMTEAIDLIAEEIPLCTRIIAYGAPATETSRCRNVTVRYVHGKPQCSWAGPPQEALDLSAFADANLRLYIESQTFHNCLNRKVYIDSGGKVRNCPAMTASHGDINTCSLKDIVCTPAFQACWKNDAGRTGKCKDCELRYACIQCPLREKECTYKVYAQT